jgi:DNA-binding NtrC family response regulator
MQTESSPLEAGTARPGLLVVDDDHLITDSLAFALGPDFEVFTCESRRHAIDLLRQLPSPPGLALVDLGLPPSPHKPDEGFALIADLLAHSPGMRIFVLSGQNDAANARHARALGAAEFIAKPCDPATIKRILEKELAFRAPDAAARNSSGEMLIGDSPASQRLRNQLGQYAYSHFPVLIEGESGTGKELVALNLHRLSGRSGRPYFALNCAAIAPTLVEPTLFGYVKGAFTGAATNKSGYFEDAQDGTLFLDEIGELPLELQAKLLRVLENGEYQRVGETSLHRSRARVLAATNRDLRLEVRNGSFRADLYHRLSVFTLTVPALRDMGADKITLLDHFRQLYASQAKVQPFEFDASASARWLEYSFPGNVRELRNIVIRLTTKFAGQRLSSKELDPEFDLAKSGPAEPLSRPGLSLEGIDAVEQAMRHLERERTLDLDGSLKAWERSYIEAALRITKGNVSQAAKLLGIHRTTLYSRMDANPK